MPPKTRYTRQSVLDAALEVVRTDGLRGMSARTVAKALGASTAPVLAAFETMQALTEAVVAALIQELLATIETTEASDPVRAAAFAMARFTADQPRYYEALFLHPHPSPPDWVALRQSFSGPLGDSDRFAHLNRRQRDALAWRASVVAHGMCIELWSGAGRKPVIRRYGAWSTSSSNRSSRPTRVEPERVCSGTGLLGDDGSARGRS